MQDSGPPSFEAGRSRVMAGGALELAGQRDHAPVELTQAMQDLSKCGANRLVDEASAGLRRLGQRVAP